MTPDERALLDAVLAEPASDAPRLVYADWLEERGGPGDAARAEFVRVQCELASRFGVPADGSPVATGGRDEDAAEVRLRRRERELLLAHASAWIPGELVAVAPGAEVWLAMPGQAGHMVGHFRRGFVAEIACTLADWYGGPCPVCQGRGTLIGDPECPECEGSGRVADPDSEWSDGTTDCPSCDRVACPACGGKGHAPGHGPALVRCQPLTRVRLSDREPERIAGGTEFGPWTWFVGDALAETSRHHIPNALWQHMPRSWYPTEDAAHAALSAAALAWAKAPPHRAIPPPDRR